MWPFRRRPKPAQQPQPIAARIVAPPLPPSDGNPYESLPTGREACDSNCPGTHAETVSGTGTDVYVMPSVVLAEIPAVTIGDAPTEPVKVRLEVRGCANNAPNAVQHRFIEPKDQIGTGLVRPWCNPRLQPREHQRVVPNPKAPECQKCFPAE